MKALPDSYDWLSGLCQQTFPEWNLFSKIQKVQTNLATCCHDVLHFSYSSIWSHFWTSEDLPQPCSRQLIFEIPFCLKRENKKLKIEQSFQGILKYSWTSPQWPPWGQKKVAFFWDLSQFGHPIAEYYWLTLYQPIHCWHIGQISVDIAAEYQLIQMYVSLHQSAKQTHYSQEVFKLYNIWEMAIVKRFKQEWMTIH